MEITLFVGVVIFFAIFTQAVAGFGLALVAMPFLVTTLGPVPAAALTSLIGLTTQIIILGRYHRALRFGPLWRVIVGALLGIPLGIEALTRLDERVILTALGLVLIVYSLYSLFRPHLPEIKRSGWGYGFGLAAGLLSGAYNTGGPPLVIYGMSRRWHMVEFKVNMQLMLLVISIFVTINHLLRGHYDTAVLYNYAFALPAIGLGALAGFLLDNYISVAVFRRLVLILLLVIGARMLLG
jgi:uncharacterized protein